MTRLRVLIACEFSGIVREEFIGRGHDAWSCDLLFTEVPGQHIRRDVREVLRDGWDLMIAHPPCTRLANSGSRWLRVPPTKITLEHYTQTQVDAYRLMSVPERLAFMWWSLEEGAALFSELWNAPIPHICVENPVIHYHAKQRIANYREFTQSIQPHQFGHGEIKRTLLWLKNLPPLQPTNNVEGREARVHRAPPSPDRWKVRSRTLQGIADAMAEQWGQAVLARKAAA